VSEVHSLLSKVLTLNLSPNASASKDVAVGGDIPGSRTHKNHGQGKAGEREFVAARSGKSMMKMDLDNCDGHVDGHSQRGQVDEQTKDEECSAEELGEGRDVAQPVGKSQVCDKLGKLVERTAREYLLGSVDGHDDSQHEAGNEG
jgi:hypothetical protein